MKSEHFEVRKAMWDGAVEKLEWLLKKGAAGDAKQPEYQRVIVVGHSLGSVVAYDALNRINNRMNVGLVGHELAGKVKGFVTIGTAAGQDRVLLPRAGEQTDRYVCRQIVNQLYGFKARDLDPKRTPREGENLVNRIERHLEGVRWLNFWDKMDPVSGPLDFYEGVENTEVNTGAGRLGAHSAYWGHPPVQEKYCGSCWRQKGRRPLRRRRPSLRRRAASRRKSAGNYPLTV